MAESSGTSGNTVAVMKKERRMRIENPFALKVGQVFTGFGIGCGLGIGVGRPLNLGAIPVLNQVMSATRGATDAFSGVGRHVNISLRKLGARNIEAGIGCGVGFGHGFGVGLAVKPGVIHQIQMCLVEAMAKMMTKFNMTPGLPVGQSIIPSSLQSGVSLLNGSSGQTSLRSIVQSTTKADIVSQSVPRNEDLNTVSTLESAASKSSVLNASHGSQTEKVINSFLQNPILGNDESKLNELAGRLQSENNMLQMVLKHQQVIEELLEENEKLRQILVEDLKVHPSKLQSKGTGKNKSLCTDCFECRRRHRKNGPF